MQGKEKTGSQRGGREAAGTSDVSHILKAINSNALWKNCSAKINKTLTTHYKNSTATRNPKKPLMTEEDIDRLFHRSKSKTRPDSPPHTARHPRPKDFANSVKFLQLVDGSDRLLNGLPSDELDEAGIDALFGSERCDLTAKFKEEYTVGKIVGEGAYASVRVAVYKPEGRKVAIKVYEKGKISDPQRKKSVRREIKILQTLDHPNIVKILNVVETNNHLNIIM